MHLLTDGSLKRSAIGCTLMCSTSIKAIIKERVNDKHSAKHNFCKQLSSAFGGKRNYVRRREKACLRDRLRIASLTVARHVNHAANTVALAH